MPRTSKLKPTEVKSRKDRDLAPWCVNVPGELSDTGKRRQLFFDTRKEAESECEKLRSRKDNFGVSLSTMTPERIATATEAYKLTDEIGVDLLVAVREYAATRKASGNALSPRSFLLRC